MFSLSLSSLSHLSSNPLRFFPISLLSLPFFPFLPFPLLFSSISSLYSHSPFPFHHHPFSSSIPFLLFPSFDSFILFSLSLSSFSFPPLFSLPSFPSNHRLSSLPPYSLSFLPLSFHLYYLPFSSLPFSVLSYPSFHLSSPILSSVPFHTLPTIVPSASFHARPAPSVPFPPLSSRLTRWAVVLIGGVVALRGSITASYLRDAVTVTTGPVASLTYYTRHAWRLVWLWVRLA